MGQRIGILLIGICLICGALAGAQELPLVYQEGDRIAAGRGYLQDLGTIKLMYLEGSPFEIGVQQGLLITYDEAAQKYKDFETLFNPLAGEHVGLKKLEVGFKQFYFHTKLRPMIKRNIPQEYWEEMEGLAFGLSRGEEPLDMDAVLMANTYLDLGANYACTSFAVYNEAVGGGPLLHSRNLDSPGMETMAQLGYVAVFRPDQGYPFIAHMYPVSCGIMQGMNTAGMSVSMNWSMVEPREKSLDGMPFTFLLRSIVQYAGTLDEAVEMIKKVPLTMGLNILISDAKTNQAVVVEGTGTRCVLRSGTSYVYAANRFLSDYLQPFQGEGWLASEFRERRLEELIHQHYGSFSPTTAVEILRDKSPQFVPGINNPSSVLTVLFQPADGLMFVSMLDDERSAPDRELLCFSLPRPFFQAWTLVRQGELYYRSGQLEEVLKVLERLEPEYEEMERVLLLKGHSLVRLNCLAEGEHYLSTLVQKQSVVEPYHLLQSWALLGVIYDTWGERERALECYREALHQEVDDLSGESNTYYRLAVVGLKKPLLWDHNLTQAILPPELGEPLMEEDLTVYEGALIQQVRVLGAHQTDPDLVQRVVGIEPGDCLSIRKLRQGERQLQNLQALERVKIAVVPGEAGVDVVIRITEPFGFYMDPVRFVVDGLLNLQRKRVSLTYHNLAGFLTNVGGVWSWGPSQEKSIFVTFPLGTAAQRLYYGENQIGNEVLWGTYAESSLFMERQAWGSNTTESLPQELVKDGHYLDIALGLASSGPRWQGGGTLSSLFPKDYSGENHWRGAFHLDTLWDLGRNFALAVDGEVKGVMPGTPFEFWPSLGGGGQLGTMSPIFMGLGYVYGRVELRKHMTKAWQLAAIWDMGKVKDEPQVLTSVGGVIRYETPIGVTVEGGYTRNLSTEHQALRFGVGLAY